MTHPLRFLRVLLVAWAGISAHAARAAVVEAVNKDSSRVILKLTQAELAAVEDDQAVLAKVGSKQVFVVSGTLIKVNPVKKTVVLVLEEPDTRFETRQSVRFLPLFYNALLSPVLTSYSQYHEYVRSSADGGVAGLYDKKMERSGDNRSKTTTTGYQLLAESHLLVVPKLVGFGFGFRHLGATSASDANGSEQKSEVTINQLRPGIWYEIEDSWVLGLRYDYTMMSVESKDDSGLAFDYLFGEPLFGITHYSDDFEFGLTYRDKAKFTAVDTLTNPVTGAALPVESTLKTPAILELWFRDIESPSFGWGMGLGYVFYERELNEGEELRTEPTVPEVLRGRLTLEWHTDDGSKADFTLWYSGGRAPGLTYQENTANMVALNLTYATPLWEQVLLGGGVEVRGGAITFTDQAVNATTGQVEDVAREVEAVGASLLAFARFEFDLLAKTRKR